MTAKLVFQQIFNDEDYVSMLPFFLTFSSLSIAATAASAGAAVGAASRGAAPSSGRGGGAAAVLRRVVARRRRPVRPVLRRGKELPVDEAKEDDGNNPHGDHGLEVLQPELVLEGGCPLLELGAAVLQGVGPLLQGRALGVTLKTGMLIENHV